MNKILVVVTSAVLVLFSGLFFSGCSRMHFCHQSPEKRADYFVKMITKELDLNDEQKAKLNKIKNEVLAKFKEAKAENADAHSKAIALIRQEKLDAATLDKFISEKEDKFKKIKPFVIEKIIEFHSMLTPEQRVKLAEKMEKIHKKHHD
jgi:periplasmic protein CpxP/Spy